MGNLYLAPDRSYRGNYCEVCDGSGASNSLPGFSELCEVCGGSGKKRRLNLFMAGGWFNWQEELGGRLAKLGKVNVLNPRRLDWPSVRSELEDQILWEHEGLKESQIILFWFPKETLCPITLYELGRWSYGHGKKVVVGAHPEYAKRRDLEIQLQMLDEPITVLNSLEELYESVSNLLLR